MDHLVIIAHILQGPPLPSPYLGNEWGRVGHHDWLPDGEDVLVEFAKPDV